MKLRKFLATAAVALIAGSSAFAQDAATWPKIYINPGHGSWGPNNRHCATIGHNPINSENPDTTDFYESNTNLRKGLALLETLKGYGVPFDETKNQTNPNPNRVGAALDLTQNIVMSHVKVGPYPYSTDKDSVPSKYDEAGNPEEYTKWIKADQKNDFNRTLSVIAAEVDANNFDMFISIHSNAATDGNRVNYLYFAYDSRLLKSDGTPKDGYEEEGAAVKATSIEMSRCGWNHRILDRHTMWSHYDYTMTAADVASGKGKIGYQALGVLNHSVPGYLVEGYFHTYQPARHRYMNFDMCRLEGVDYARGVADYFGWAKESTGDICGVVRDKHEKFSDEVYNPAAGTYDVYKPLNSVVVTLKKDGVEVATDTTDVNYNGLFTFRQLEPGDYTIEFAHADYKADSVWTTDKAVEEVATSIPVTVKAAVTSYPTAFLESIAYEPPSVIYVNYPDSLAGKDFVLAEEINVKAGVTNTALAEKLTAKTVRRQIVRDDKMYVLALDAENVPYIYYVNLSDNNVIELDKVAVVANENDSVALSDIALTADHVLIGSAFSTNTYGGSAITQLYKWTVNEETGAPEACEKWISTTNSGNCNTAYMGKSLAYTGTLSDGRAVITAEHNTRGSLRFTVMDVSEAAKVGEAYWVKMINPAQLPKTDFGEDYQIMVSPLYDELVADHDNFILDGSNGAAIEWTEAGSATDVVINGKLSTELLSIATNGANYFKYAGKSLMVAPSINADGKVEGVKLIDITDGFSDAKEVVLGGATLAEPIEYKYVSAHGGLALTIDELTGMTTDAEIELFLVVDGNVTKFTTEGVKQPVYNGVYAYDLSAEVADATATLSFNLNSKSNNVDIVLTPTTEGGEEVIYNAGAMEAGANTYTIDLATLAKGDYNWSVSVANKAIYAGDILTTINTWGAGTASSARHRGGIAVESNPESEYFGTTYLAVGKSKGVFLLDPMYQVQDGAPYWVGQFNTGNASSTFRGALYNDKFYLTDWSDAYPGIWIFDPANPTEINNIFAGATNDGTGKLSIDGVDVGGGSTGVAFTGEGADRKMFIYVEDLPAGNDGNKLYRYDIGAEDKWGAVAPTLLEVPSAKLVNTNTGMLGSALHNVVFCSQTRTAGNNATGVPAFLVIDEEGNIVFNGGDLKETLDGCQGGGMALSADESKFAIVDASSAIQVYDVEWTENVPSFTHALSIPTNAQEICQMSFDYAGNLHCINRSYGYYVHSVPCDARDIVTPAKATSILTGTSGIEIVDVEDVEAPVEYYNLQGVKVANPSNGIFIKKQGNKATKVVL